jgi:hypothetical protein
MLIPPERCLRHLTTCDPLAQIVSDEMDEQGNPRTFICVGANDGSERVHPQDWYTQCWKSVATDDRYHLDLRDLLHTQSVIAQALTMIEFSQEERA